MREKLAVDRVVHTWGAGNDRHCAEPVLKPRGVGCAVLRLPQKPGFWAPAGCATGFARLRNPVSEHFYPVSAPFFFRQPGWPRNRVARRTSERLTVDGQRSGARVAGAADFRPLRALSDLEVSLLTCVLATVVMACVEVATALMLPSIRQRSSPKRRLRLTIIKSRSFMMTGSAGAQHIPYSTLISVPSW